MLPSFTAGPNQVVTDESGANSVNGWATALGAGPADEAGQTLTFSTSTTNENLFAALPAIDPTGRLTFTPAHNASGTATVTVSLKDSGGTENGGIDTSASQTFTIKVENPRPLQNSELRQDVDGNDEVSPLDALLIINYLNGDNPTEITVAAGSANYYDVSGDNEIAPLDALLIINFLNDQLNGEGEGSADSSDGPLGPDGPHRGAGRRHRRPIRSPATYVLSTVTTTPPPASRSPPSRCCRPAWRPC